MRKISELGSRFWVFFSLFILLVLYSLFQARFLILGPNIRITSPLDGARVESPVVELLGVASNISYISVNDRPIFVNEKGDFDEKLIVPVGLSIITMKAKDRFGRETEKVTRVVYNKQE